MIEFRNNEKADINKKYTPTEKEQRDREQVYKRYADMKFSRADIQEKWDKWERQYESWRPPKDNDDWQSTIVPPFTTTIVEKALSEIIDQTIQPVIKPRGEEDVVKAKVMNYIKDYTWEIGDGDLELYAAIKQSLILGKTIWKEYYWKDQRRVKVLKKFDPEKNEEEYVEKDITDYDDVYGENMDIRNFFIDPMARTINRGPYKANDVIERKIMNYDTFMETFKDSLYDQFGHVSLVKPGGDLNYYQFYTPPEGIDKDNQVEVLWYWARRPDKCIIVANDVVIRDGPNPFNHKQLPFAEGSDVPRLNQFWANSEPKLLESIQDELTTLRRMRVDRQHMDLWKLFMVSNRETLDDDEAIIAPSRFLYVDDPNNSIKALDYNPVHPTAYQEEEALRQDGREVTGVQSPQPASTATESAIFKEATMKSLRLKIWLISRELLTGLTRLRVPNIIQFYTVPKVEKVIGGKRFAEYRQISTEDVQLQLTKEGDLKEVDQKGTYFFTVSPDLIVPQYGGYNYKLSGEPTFPISKPLQQQKVAEFMQHPVIQAAVQTGYYDVGKLADQLSDINDFDPDKFKSQQTQDRPDVINEETMYELANRENEQMLQGIEIPGTPYAPRTHTDIHLAFMRSQAYLDAFAQMDDAEKAAITRVFSKHILYEQKAQETRAQAGQIPQLFTEVKPGSEAQSIEAGEAQATEPARRMGPGPESEGVASLY